MPAVENHLIELLPRKERLSLLKICEPIDLVLSEILFEPGSLVRYVYFPTDGFISLLTAVDEHSSLEVGMVGREGMVGSQVALGFFTENLRALVQGPGLAWRIECKDFRNELVDNIPLQQMLKRYLYVLMLQSTRLTGCMRFHVVEARLARWLLMSQDCSHGNSFYMTQEFLGFMLGVRRVGITLAAGSLQRNGLIEYSRGYLTVLDRKGLEAVACSCYAGDRKSYSECMN